MEYLDIRFQTSGACFLDLYNPTLYGRIRGNMEIKNLMIQEINYV